MAKTPRKTPIRRLIHRAWSQAHLVPLIPIRGEAAGAEEVEAGVGVEAEAEATTRKKWYCIFLKENDDHRSNYCPGKKRFEAILEEEMKEKGRASAVNHSASAWQNPSFGRNSFANPFQPSQYQPSPSNYPQPPPWQSQTFEAQNIERRPVEQHHIPPPPPPYKGPSAPPLPAKLEGQSDPLPSVGTIMPISGGSALEFETKKERKHYFRDMRNICVEGRVEKTRWSHIPTTFSEEDVRLQGFPHNDALVIEANIASWTLGKLLVDNGSSADVIFADAFDKMGLNRDLLQPPDTPLYGFGGRVIHALGKVVLPVSFGTVQNARTEYLSFDVVEMYYPYNGILGRGFLNKFETVIHQAYLCIKIPATLGVITI
jgi:hypothetical protein